VITLVGAQKIVSSLTEGVDRLDRYSLPLEEARARVAYGAGSSINRILVFRSENQPGRTTMVLVKEKVGF
jgi:hypothetical protein